MPFRGNNCTKQAIADAMLYLPDLSSGLKNLLLQLLGVLPADNPQLTALTRYCPWLKKVAFSKVMQPTSNDC